MKKSVRFNFRNFSTQFLTVSLVVLIATSLCLTGESNASSVKINEDTTALSEFDRLFEKELEKAEEAVFADFISSVSTPSVMKFINLEGEVLFEAIGAEIWEMKDKKLEGFFYNSDFLMEFANEHYYLVK